MGNSSWKRCKIADLGTVVGGATPSTKDSTFWDGNIPWITPKDLSGYSDRFISRGGRNITKKGFDSCSTQMIPKNSVLFSSRAPIGYVAIASNDLCTNQGFKSVVPNKNTDFKFLYYLLKYQAGNIERIVGGGGSTFNEVSGSAMRNIDVFVPSLPVQKQIAAVLSAIDEKIELNNRMNTNLEAAVQSIYKNWFIDFVPFGGEMPSDWKIESIAKNGISHVIKPKVDKFDTKIYFATADVNGLKTTNGKEITYATRESRANMQPRENSVWFAKMKNSVKHLLLAKNSSYIIENVILSTGFCGIQCTEESFEYVATYIRNPNFEIEKNHRAHGTTQEAVNLDDLAKIEMVVPSKNVLANFHELAEPAYMQITRNMNESRKLIELRDTLLPKLMSGEIDVSNIEVNE